MKSLHDQERIKRDRYSLNEPYFYYLKKRPAQVEHTLGVNWVYVWFQVTCGTHHDITHWEREISFNDIRSDAICLTKDILHNSYDLFFIEFDNADSGNDFNKVHKYGELFLSDEPNERWWYRYLSHKPVIIVVTNGNKERILKRIKNDNRYGLIFRVYTLEEIKGAVL